MPIREYMDARAGVFGPEDIKLMNAVFEEALKTSGFVKKDDPVVRLLAARIINGVRQGERDPNRLCMLATERGN